MAKLHQTFLARIRFVHLAIFVKIQGFIALLRVKSDTFGNKITVLRKQKNIIRGTG